MLALNPSRQPKEGRSLFLTPARKGKNGIFLPPFQVSPEKKEETVFLLPYHEGNEGTLSSSPNVGALNSIIHPSLSSSLSSPSPPFPLL